jgi:hypothetical protein
MEGVGPGEVIEAADPCVFRISALMNDDIVHH